jgi:dienelactone hydrolase
MLARLLGLLTVVAMASALWFWPRPVAIDAEVACHVGAWRLDDGRTVDLSPVSDGHSLRWRLLDGRSGRLQPDPSGGWRNTSGWTERPAPEQVALGDCRAPALRFDGQAAQRLAFEVREIRFPVRGAQLAGRLLLPRGDAPVPVAVLVHGSEDWSAIQYQAMQRLLPAQGVGVFVYDKRGTGTSSGRYTQDFDVLANDAVAAQQQARRLAGARAARVGFSGGSQAGWIAPLAATRSDADFVAVTYGLADSPLAEDRDQVMLDLQAAGHGADVLAKAREVTDATGAIMASGFRDGYARLEALRDRYGQEPWWQDLRGEFTGQLVRHPAFALRLVGPLIDTGTTWEYDPMPVLRAQRAPLLWILAGADREAPPEETRRRLLEVARTNPRLTVVEFPDTDHGVLEFETAADGERTSTRVAEGYYSLLADWIRDGGVGERGYGRAVMLARPGNQTQ